MQLGSVNMMEKFICLKVVMVPMIMAYYKFAKTEGFNLSALLILAIEMLKLHADNLVLQKEVSTMRNILTFLLL